MDRNATVATGAFPYTLGAHTWNGAAVSLNRKLNSRKKSAISGIKLIGLIDVRIDSISLIDLKSLTKLFSE
jgi:hypothetical protein